jgi:hypothetical protein
MINFLKKANTVATIVTTVYAVGKFMYDTFKWYEKKHGKKKDIEEDDKGTV